MQKPFSICKARGINALSIAGMYLVKSFSTRTCPLHFDKKQKISAEYSGYFLHSYLISNTDFTFKLVASPETIFTRFVPLPISKKLSDNTKSSLSLLI